MRGRAAPQRAAWSWEGSCGRRRPKVKARSFYAGSRYCPLWGHPREKQPVPTGARAGTANQGALNTEMQDSGDGRPGCSLTCGRAGAQEARDSGLPRQQVRPARVGWVLESALCTHAWLAQSCPTLCDPTGCRLPGSSVHGILQARVPEWVGISFSRGSSRLGDQIHVSASLALTGGFFTSCSASH